MSILSQFKQSQNTDFPNVRPSLDLRFALAKKLDPRVTFTRGSTGTYFGSDGLMRTAGVNEPRFDHDPATGQSLGLLIEESRQNYELYSGDPTQWASNQNMTLTGNSIVLPDGTTSTNVEYRGTDSGANVKILRPGPSGAAVVAGETWTFSIFLRAGTEQTVSLNFQSNTGSDGVQSIFNMVTGQFPGNIGGTNAANGSRGFQYVGNGWYRVWLTNTYQSIFSGQQTFVRLRTNSTSVQYTTSFSAWGAQLEKGAFPTSYIPTVASTVTRSADNASVTGTNFSSWYNQSEGTIVISTDKLYSGNFDAYRHPYKIDSGSNEDGITAYTLPGATTITNYGITNTGRQVFDYQQIFIGSSPTQFKVGQSLNSKYSFFTSSKGTTPPQLPSKSAPNGQNLSLATNMSRLFIGSHNTGGQINSHIARLTYYPLALTDKQLINLTS